MAFEWSQADTCKKCGAPVYHSNTTPPQTKKSCKCDDPKPAAKHEDAVHTGVAHVEDAPKKKEEK